MHACWGIPQLEAGCTWGKHAEKLLKNYTYMHACMHAGAPLSWKPVTPEEKICKISVKIRHTCMHARASLSWKPVAPDGKMRKNKKEKIMKV